MQKLTPIVNIFSRSYVSLVSPVKGTRDVYGTEALKTSYLKNSFRQIADLYSFKEISTPIIENIALFNESLGEDSDVVSKEMYVFNDKNDNKIALRPEGTAGVMRAFLGSTLKDQSTSLTPVNFVYEGPMFRYERPQAGRYRQFTQLGAESIGSAHPNADINIIAFGAQLLQRWDILQHTVVHMFTFFSFTLEINTLGDSESRSSHREVLIDYLESYRQHLSPLSVDRLNRGSALRILDSKEEKDQPIIGGAPSIHNYLTPSAKERFQRVLKGLDDLKIRYLVNETLVRGLDYYSHTCFEFTTDNLGSQSAILAGGRYDGLPLKIGHDSPVPAIGWAIGVERAALLLSDTHPELEKMRSQTRAVAVLPVSDGSNEVNREANELLRVVALNLTLTLRLNGIPAILIDHEDLGKEGDQSISLRKQLSLASKQNCLAAIIFGSTEVSKEEVAIKNLDKTEQKTVPFEFGAIQAEIRKISSF